MTIYRFDRELFLAVIRELSNLRKILKMGKHETVGMFGATAFGALWQPFSLGVQIFGIGFIFGKLFDLPVEKYVPFLCLGIILWNALVNIASECAGCINLDTTTDTPYQKLIIYPLRICSKNLFLTFLNFIVFVIVATLFSISFEFLQIVTFLFGTAIFCFILTFFGIFCALIGSYYRDFPHIVRNFFSLMFFVTPVMWEPGALQHKWVFLVNPLFHLIEMVRKPLIDWDSYQLFPTVTLMLLGFLFAVITVFLWSGLIWRAAYKQ